MTLVPVSCLYEPHASARAGPRCVLQARLLCDEEFLVPLYRRLEVPVLDVTTLLVKVYLPAFGSMEETSQNDLLAYVASHWRRLQEHVDLLQTLSNIAFVPTGALSPTPVSWKGRRAA